MVAGDFLRPRAPCVVDNGGALVVADSGHNKIRLLQFIVTRSGASVEVQAEMRDIVIAGDGRRGFRDGVSGEAQFNQPSGLCALTDGSLLVVSIM